MPSLVASLSVSLHLLADASIGAAQRSHHADLDRIVGIGAAQCGRRRQRRQHIKMRRLGQIMHSLYTERKKLTSVSGRDIKAWSK